MSSHACSRCGSNRMHRSRVRGLARAVLVVIRWRPYRCHACGHAEWQHVGRSPFDAAPKSRKRAVVTAGVVLAVGAVTGLSVIYLAAP